MLLDTLQDTQVYFKSTLLEVLQETKSSSGIVIPVSYKSIMRREKQRIPVYIDVRRDPTNGWRMYTGKQIRDIIEYELSQKEKKQL